MENFEPLKDGEIGLVMVENGRIIQLGMTAEVQKTITILIASVSQSHPLVRLGEEHNLVLKSQALGGLCKTQK